ncbi:hypothetical protein SAMN05444374_10979 [Rhodococcoides kroppenstedtii]|uniref:Uncharacterized protein n=1 Tax=Rhodococcoides kroppenstedtii TaxID=293050 RepID=A0A1I0TSM8_9NOCA|nr:hypothetical protein SAMN05444374_10979 [Rhodococcus kroppenstedtii]
MGRVDRARVLRPRRRRVRRHRLKVHRPRRRVLPPRRHRRRVLPPRPHRPRVLPPRRPDPRSLQSSAPVATRADDWTGSGSRRAAHEVSGPGGVESADNPRDFQASAGATAHADRWNPRGSDSAAVFSAGTRADRVGVGLLRLRPTETGADRAGRPTATDPRDFQGSALATAHADRWNPRGSDSAAVFSAGTRADRVGVGLLRLRPTETARIGPDGRLPLIRATSSDPP